MKKNNDIGWIVAGSASAAAILGSIFLLGLPVLAAVLIGLLVFGGVWLLATPSGQKVMDTLTGAEKIIADLKKQIVDDWAKVRAIRKHAEIIPDQEIRTMLLRTCDLADKVFQNFVDDPRDIKDAHKFLMYVNKSLPMVVNYARLVSDEHKVKALQERDHENFRSVSGALGDSFETALIALQENDVAELRAATGTLGALINIDKGDIR